MHAGAATTASELATAQSFVIDLCTLLEVTRPHPTPEQDCMFERPVTFARGDGSTSAGRIDCYRRGRFVLVVDVGTVIEVYTEFSKTGGTYAPYPDPRSHRIALADLTRPEGKTACAASGSTPTASTQPASAPRSPATWPHC